MGSAGLKAVLAVVVVLLLVPAHALAAPGMFVGIDDDTAKWMGRPNGLYTAYQDLGLGAVRITIPWHRGDTHPTRLQQTYLHRVAMLMALGERVVLAVYGRPAQAPTTPTLRTQYCGYLAHVLVRLPVRDVVIWNEANNPTFWPSSAGATGYERLLATCWDTLHALHRHVNVITSTAARHDPAGFIERLGAAYRASRRARPIADTFGHNPYPRTSAEAPWTAHGDGTIGEGDLPILLGAYHEAFDGTPQPPPGTGRATIWYLEDGFQTTVPAPLRPLYRGTLVETDLAPVSAVQQAAQLTDAVELAYCQPAVGAFFNFELLDGGRLSGWQSGLLWRNGTRKPAYEAYKQAAAAVAAGTVDCATVQRAASSSG